MATSYWDRRAAQADDLLGQADEMGELAPGTRPARVAARLAVQAADVLASDRGSAADLRRLAQALWRQASAFMVSGQRAAALAPARRCWLLTELALTMAPPGEPGWDQAIADAVRRLGVVMPALAAGRPGEAEQLYRACTAAVADDTARPGLPGHPDRPGGGPHPARVRRRWPGRDHRAGHRAADGQPDTDRGRRAAPGRGHLDEAIALAASVAARGPAYRALLQGLRAERDGLRRSPVEPAP